MSEIITNGSYRTADGRAQIDWELRSTPKGPEFSAAGSYSRSCGQCLDGIAEAYPNDEMVKRIHRVWKAYHLNGMRAGTPKQEELGWGHGRDVALDLTSMNNVQKAALAERNLRAVSDKRAKFAEELRAKLGSNQRARKQLWDELFPGQVFTTWADETVKAVARFRQTNRGIPAYRSRLAERLPDYLSHAAELQFPAAPVAAEIFSDSIGAPCPETGKLYGHEWYYHPIPDDVLTEIESWPTIQQSSGSLGEFQAKRFLHEAGVTMRITLSDSKPAQWEPAGHHYRVTLSRREQRLAFDYWGSKADANKNKAPTECDILTCIASDICVPEALAEFCSEFGGDPDSIRTRQTFVRASRFAKNLRAFFSKREIDDLSESFN